MSRRSSNNDLNDSSENEELTRIMQARRATLLRQHSMPLSQRLPVLVRQFLKATSVPYVIIGGKAAEYHVMHHFKHALNDRNTLAITSTLDYDVIVAPQNVDKFVQEFRERARAQVDLNKLAYSEKDMGPVVIHSIGTMDRGFMNSVLDIHAYKADKVPRATVADDGLRYANASWLAKEIRMRESSSDEPTKAWKRHTRLKYLDKLTPRAGSRA